MTSDDVLHFWFDETTPDQWWRHDPVFDRALLTRFAATVELFRECALRNLDHELRHNAIIDRFGCFPRRNAVLGGKSSADERAFLAQEGSSFWAQRS